MFARAKSISHCLKNLRYITGESSNKKKPEKISHVVDHLFENLDAEGMWRSMQLDLHKSRSWRRIENGVIRIELSPIMENTAGFTRQDWIDLWNDFVAEFDAIQLRDKQGEIYSDCTDIAGSKYTVWLHEESDSGIPHLHADVCRVNHDGKINNDHDIHLRAQEAATKVALKRGWETTMDRHENNVERVSKDCMEVLRQMQKWSFDEYFSLLTAKGYECKLREDENHELHGYSLKSGNTIYKASLLGEGRCFTVKNIEATWKRLHPNGNKQQTTDNNPVAKPASSPKKKKAKKTASAPVTSYPGNVHPYTEYRQDYTPLDVQSGGKSFRHYLPVPFTDYLNDEFDYREIANCEQLKDLTAALFLGYLDALSTTGSGGGGGTSSDLNWGRDPKEDEFEFLKRCAQKAKAHVGVVKRSGVKR